jgi:uncharacterized NAD(P)/FAD-binding protein YdhS
MLRELWATLVDVIREGDLVGHLQAWWDVVGRRVTPETRAGWPTRSGD